MIMKEDVCVVSKVTCTRSLVGGTLREKCNLICENENKDLRVTVKGRETKQVTPGKAYAVRIEDVYGIEPV